MDFLNLYKNTLPVTVNPGKLVCSRTGMRYKKPVFRFLPTSTATTEEYMKRMIYNLPDFLKMVSFDNDDPVVTYDFLIT